MEFEFQLSLSANGEQEVMKKNNNFKNSRAKAKICCSLRKQKTPVLRFHSIPSQLIDGPSMATDGTSIVVQRVVNPWAPFRDASF